jgi:predicted dehydrogenase
MRVACLGAGYFSRFHIDGWRRVAGVDLVGMCDLERAKAEATGVEAFTSLEAMVERTRPDIIDIILPPVAQADAIRAALSYTPRAIICQKPFCTSPTEAQELTALAQQRGVPLIIHENFRFQPWYRSIADSIAAGDIGAPLQACFRLRPGDGQGVDAYTARQPYFRAMERFLIHETGVHFIDTFRFLFGDPSAVYADLRRVNPEIAGEDAGYVVFEHPGEVRSVFDGNRCLDHPAENTRCTMGEGLFEGTEGTLTLLGDGRVHLRRFGQIDTVELLAPDSTGLFGGDCTHLLQAHVAQALATGDTPENLASDYLRVIEIEQAIYASAEQGRRITLDHDDGTQA